MFPLAETEAFPSHSVAEFEGSLATRIAANKCSFSVRGKP